MDKFVVAASESSDGVGVGGEVGDGFREVGEQGTMGLVPSGSKQ